MDEDVLDLKRALGDVDRGGTSIELVKAKAIVEVLLVEANGASK